MDSYITVKQSAEYRFEERRSEFIGLAAPVSEEEDAIAFINAAKKRFPDARHWVYAYVLRKNAIMRFSDDREPQGTAGMPTLDAIRKSGCSDVVIVVVRYFGGILLGTGGLVHAYSEAATGALKEAKIIKYDTYSKAEFETSYSDYQKILPILSEFNFSHDDIIYADNIKIEGSVRADLYESFSKKITESTAGRCEVVKKSEYFDYRE